MRGACLHWNSSNSALVGTKQWNFLRQCVVEGGKDGEAALEEPSVLWRTVCRPWARNWQVLTTETLGSLHYNRNWSYCINYFPHFCGKLTWQENRGRKDDFVLWFERADCYDEESMVAGVWDRCLEISCDRCRYSGHFLLLSSPGSQPREWCCIYLNMSFNTSINTIYKLHRYLTRGFILGVS